MTSPDDPINFTDAEISRVLMEAGVQPTVQRVSIGRILLGKDQHVSAEQVFRAVNRRGPIVSKATVYNTLSLLAKKGVIREVTADPQRILYDTNVIPHHHIYDEVTGQLQDVERSDVVVTGLPPLPLDTELCSIEVMIRVRRRAKD